MTTDWAWNKQHARQIERAYPVEGGRARAAISDDELQYWREKKIRQEQNAMDVLREISGRGGILGLEAEARLRLMERIRLDP